MFPARFPGRCAVTGAPIAIGDTIRSIGRGRYALVSRATRTVDPVDPIDADIALAESIDPGCSAADSDAAAHAGAYLRRSMGRGLSDIWRSGGREYYRNRRGLCEDAPCCGCCNA